MIGDPPLFAGAANATAIWPTPGVTPVTDGAPGAPGVTTASDGADAGPLPTMFLAMTVHRYVFALVNNITVTGDPAPDAVLVMPPLLDVHVAV